MGQVMIKYKHCCQDPWQSLTVLAWLHGKQAMVRLHGQGRARTLGTGR